MCEQHDGSGIDSKMVSFIPCFQSLAIWRSLNLSFCFLLVGEDLNVIPQHRQNFPSWEKKTSHLLQYLLPAPYWLLPKAILEYSLSHIFLQTIRTFKK